MQEFILVESKRSIATQDMQTLALWNGMERTVQFVWTIPAVDLLTSNLFSKQVHMTVHGKEHKLCLNAYLCNNIKVNIKVIYHAGQNKECQTCELDVQFAVMPFLVHDQTLDAAEGNLEVGIQLPRSMLCDMPMQSDLNNWRDPVAKCYATHMGKSVDIVKFTRLVVYPNVRFVASNTY